MKVIEYGASIYGYTVEVSEGGRVIETYTAGNANADSTLVLNPKGIDAPHCVALGTLQTWAKATAREMAQERGIPVGSVQENTDIAPDYSGADLGW